MAQLEAHGLRGLARCGVLRRSVFQRRADSHAYLGARRGVGPDGHAGSGHAHAVGLEQGWRHRQVRGAPRPAGELRHDGDDYLVRPEPDGGARLGQRQPRPAVLGRRVRSLSGSGDRVGEQRRLHGVDLHPQRGSAMARRHAAHRGGPQVLARPRVRGLRRASPRVVRQQDGRIRGNDHRRRHHAQDNAQGGERPLPRRSLHAVLHHRAPPPPDAA